MNQPLKKYRAGSVSAAVWENEATVNGQKVTLRKATVERRYKDKDGNWQSSGSFGRNEIPLAIYVLGKVFGVMVGEAVRAACVSHRVLLSTVWRHISLLFSTIVVKSNACDNVALRQEAGKVVTCQCRQFVKVTTRFSALLERSIRLSNPPRIEANLA
jgi:hypothetical protein